MFDISRYNEHTYKPPEPWTRFDSGYIFDSDNSWVCKYCWAAAGYQIHYPHCRYRSKLDDQK